MALCDRSMQQRRLYWIHRNGPQLRSGGRGDDQLRHWQRELLHES